MEDELKYFKIEAEEILESMTGDFLKLEKSIDDTEIINTLFRHAHTLKGAASVVNLSIFSSLFHKLEDMLSFFLKNKSITSNDITIMLDAISVAGDIVEVLKNGKNECEIDTSEIIELLTNTLEEKNSKNQKLKKDSNEICINNKENDCDFDIKKDHNPINKDKINNNLSTNINNKDNNIKNNNKDNDIFDDLNIIKKKINDSQKKNESSQTKKKSKSESISIRIKSQDIDSLTDFSNELLINTARMNDIMESLRNFSSVLRKKINSQEIQIFKQYENELEKLDNNLERNDLFSKEISDIIMKARLISIRTIKYYFEKIVRDLSISTKKKIEFSIVGEELLLDRDMIETIKEPLYHLLRNSIIHGIESINERFQKKKPIAGTLKLIFEKHGDFVNIKCHDDGRGLDPAKIKNIAKKKNILDSKTIDEMSDNEAINLIFATGFSTVDNISELAGRGIGMDIVKNTISNIGGFFNIDSVVEKYTSFVITLPCSINLIETFMVKVLDHNLLIPLKNVVEAKIIEKDEIHLMAGNKSIIYNDLTIPLVHTGELLKLNNKHNDNNDNILAKYNVIIIRDNEYLAALIIDEFIGKRQNIVKPLEGELNNIEHLRSSTILEDGNPAFVINVGNIIEQIKSGNSIKFRIENKVVNKKNILVVDDSLTTRTLICGILEKNGYIVKSANSGDEALLILNENNYDLIMTDVEMPGINGFELTQEIRKRKNLSPIIILTSLSDNYQKRKGIEAGANAYIVKGKFDKDSFLKTIESLI